MKAAVLGACLAVLGSLAAAANPAGAVGADLPWTTYEAEAMQTSGVVLGPGYQPYQVETESSGERCVRLADGQDVAFTADAAANALVVRYSVPDAATGGGIEATLVLEVNGHAVRTLALSSRFSHLYGDYPFTNDPRAGKPRAFYDEARVSGLKIAAGDCVRLRKAAGGAPDCIVDLVDLEAVPAPRGRPPHALSVLDFGAARDGAADATGALRACIAAAAKSGRIVWVPAGRYRLTGDIVVPSAVTIQGAGMWETTFVGDEALYRRPDRRVRFKLAGRDIRLADFAIVGRLDYRNDQEPNDGIIGAGCTDSSIERIWIEHTKVGIWIYNGKNLRIEGCRFRDTLADGINLCVGTTGCVVENCTARGTGDDCFAIWPAPADQGFAEAHRPGHNVIRHCTGQLPFLANGAAIYGGAGNRIEDCRFTDITAGSGILISTTFPTADAEHDNAFSGTTVVRNCALVRCGGFDHDWGWRAALEFCADRRDISGVVVSDVNIRDSLSSAVAVLGPGSAHGQGRLTNTVLRRVQVEGVGLGARGWGLRIRADARGELGVADSALGGTENGAQGFVVHDLSARQD